MISEINDTLIELVETNQTAVAPSLQIQTAVRGQKVAETHIDDEDIYLLLSGQLWLEQDLQLLDFAQAGELVDMLDLWEFHGSGLAVVAHGDCQYVKIDDNLAQLLEMHPPEFVVQIIEKMISHIPNC